MQDVLNEMIDDNILNTYRFKYTYSYVSIYFFFSRYSIDLCIGQCIKKKKKKEATDIHINSQTKSIDNI